MSGSGGEKENAISLFQQMLEEHSLTKEQFINQLNDLQEFTLYNVSGTEQVKLALQIVGMVLDTNKVSVSRTRMNGKRRYLPTLIITCTPSQFIEIEDLYNHYRQAYMKQKSDFFKKQKQAFLSAFFNKNDLYPSKQTELPSHRKKRKSQVDLEVLMSIFNSIDGVPAYRRKLTETTEK